MKRPILCLVTDRTLLHDRPLVELIGRAALAGVDLIHLRERDLPDGELLDVARAAVGAVRGTQSRVVINDRVDVALAAGAAGVHLRGDSMGASRVREMTGADFLIGRSVHDPAEASAVQREGGCDYLVFGTVFPSASKPRGHHAAGVSVLAEVCAAVDLPVLAIGGVSVAAAPAVARAGAAGAAAIRLFADAPDLEQVIQQLRAGLTHDSALP